MYQATTTDAVIRLADGAVIPADPGNRDSQAYERWQQAGGTPQPAALAPAALRMIAKTTIYRRATDAEIGTFEAWLDSGATPRQRLMWRDATNGMVFVEDAMLAITAMWGAARAAELLAE
jgi:hypothetical protein